jgi:predicted transcriptional regulator
VVATGVRCAKCRNRRVPDGAKKRCDEHADWLRRTRSSIALLQRDNRALISSALTHSRAYAGGNAIENSIVHRQSATAKLHGECDS